MQQINALPNQTGALPTNTLDLKDIHLPEQIANYPTAYGWWLLAALLILFIAFAIIKFRKAVKRNKIKKQALAQLANSTMSNSEVIAILKWAAMHYFSRVEVAKLFGDSLQAFLLSKLTIKHQQRFTELSEQAFLNQYHKNNNSLSDESFHQAAVLWLTHALPPKPVKKLAVAHVNKHQTISQGVST